MLAQLVGASGADDLIEHVFDNAHRKAGRDILDAGAILLRLLDRGIHKDSAAGAQVHRVLGKQSQAGKFLCGVAHRLGKGLDKGAAAGGACLVEHDRVDGVVFNLEALDVLAADVEDKLDLRVKVLGGLEVGDGLDDAVVQMESVLDQFLAVAGGDGIADVDPVAAGLIEL